MRSLTALAMLATLALASACSSKNDVPAPVEGGWEAPPTVSGTRLRARFITAGDARQLVGFYDSQRKEVCTFQRAEGERMRCLPATTTYSPAGVFSDAACQIPLGSPQGSPQGLPQGSPCGGAAKYAVGVRYDGGCGATSTELRRVLDVPSARYAAGPSGCTPLPASPSLSSLVALGEIVPWTDFVEAVETPARGGALDETILVASDGARQHASFRIGTLDAECTFQIMSDGQARCVPAGRVGPVLYADSECTKASFVHAYESGPCAAGATKFWLEQAPATATCPGIRAVYSLHDSSTTDDSSSVYSETSSGSGTTTTTTCSENGSGGYYSQSRRAIDVNLTASLPTVNRIGRGSGRLVPALVARAGSQELALGWHDNERHVDCSFAVASDGKLRCLPTAPPATLFFTDTACKSPTRVAILGQATCTGPAPPFALLASTTCPATTRVYALAPGARTITAASTEIGPGRCASVPSVSNAFDASEADPAGFVEGVPITE